MLERIVRLHIVEIRLLAIQLSVVCHSIRPCVSYLKCVGPCILFADTIPIVGPNRLKTKVVVG